MKLTWRCFVPVFSARESVTGGYRKRICRQTGRLRAWHRSQWRAAVVVWWVILMPTSFIFMGFTCYCRTEVFYLQIFFFRNLQNICLPGLNSLWPSDAIWWHGTGSTLTQVIACCYLATSHCLNQCWLMLIGPIAKNLWKFYENIFFSSQKNVSCPIW